LFSEIDIINTPAR